MVKALDFNEEVCLDTLAQDGTRIETLSALDMATGYHVVKKIYGKKSTDMLKCFVDAWVMWVGPPLSLTVDQERGFIKEFVDGLVRAGHYYTLYCGTSSLATRSGGKTGTVV